MGLTGIDSNDPIPSDRREFLPGQGPQIGPGASRDVIIYANKTSAGTDVVETVTTPIASDSDARARLGPRSEAYWLWWAFSQIPQDANVFVCPPAEAGGGTAGTVTFTFGTLNSDVSQASATATISWAGFTTTFSITTGGTTATDCAAFVAALNNAMQGTWPFTAVQGASSSTNVATVTSANVGDRATYFLTPLIVTLSTPVLYAGSGTIVKGSVTNGTGTDDHTNAYAAANAAGEFFYQVSAKSSVSTVTSTDNGVGELIFDVNQSILPLNGKSQTCYFGLIGTAAQGVTTVTSSGANSPYAFFFRAKNSPWAPGMIAAHGCAVVRAAQVAQPSANINGYANGASTPLLIPPPYLKTDQPTTTEIQSDLNNGISSIAFDQKGNASIVRFITSKSLTGTATDYRIREGHIPSAQFFGWAQIQQRWATERQPFVDDDLPSGAKPLPLTAYPTTMKQIAFAVIDDLTSATPVQGTIRGPVLNPSSTDAMKQSVVALKIPGGLSLSIDWRVVEHLIRTETTLREVSPSQ